MFQGKYTGHYLLFRNAYACPVRDFKATLLLLLLLLCSCLETFDH